MSEFPEVNDGEPATLVAKPRYAGGRPKGSRDKVRRKPRGLATPPESNGGGELSLCTPEPAWTVENERGWHMLAAHLCAMGVPGAQIAREFNKDPDVIYNLQRQGWFVAKVNALVAERGADVMELLRGAQTTAIQTVIAILNDPMVPARVRLMAADSIIDRCAGKATQRIEAVGVAPSSDPVAEVAQIEREMEQQGWVRGTKLPSHPSSSDPEEGGSPHDGDQPIVDPSIPTRSPQERPIPSRGLAAPRPIIPSPRDGGGGGESFRTYYE